MDGIERIDHQQALHLYEECSFHELARRAGALTEHLHPGSLRTYVIERNINYTNVCQARCSFCAFSVSPRDPRAFTLSYEQICDKITPLVALGGTQILMQGGMNPALSLNWHEQMLQHIKDRFPSLHVHAFSPPEIVFFARQSDLPVRDVLQRLRQAGLDTVPGGGAEILVDRVRNRIAPAKCSSSQWLDVMRQAHRLNMCTTATMMFGHVETLAERIEHLDRLRQLQDESLQQRSRHGSGGVFTAFTCWPFQPGNTRLANPARPHADDQLHLAGALEQLKMTALARLYLDNIPNIQASWVTQGPRIAQVSLLSGCNDMGSLMMEENVVSAAGTTFRLELEHLRQLIRTAGFTPMQRDCYYDPVQTAP